MTFPTLVIFRDYGSYAINQDLGNFFQIRTVDGRNPTPPGMYKTL